MLLQFAAQRCILERLATLPFQVGNTVLNFLAPVRLKLKKMKRLHHAYFTEIIEEKGIHFHFSSVALRVVNKGLCTKGQADDFETRLLSKDKI